ncbi:bifunctional 4-hydroxy-2-oxoglutarate aldolase/2-dehydro-3-deoxy-phosphogluconate aldolase [Nonomuraea gerenzanensis]|uniref:4-Hydroxy-2-oxoglutarate aldolase @ 2-dehydro-3-deoxyphosphogluconate aldolase n=1 Tax=Nonomuraea gerenzanensis TaxID=93944 RepID=A0A1M4EEZ0_9ACTN|nr:bifunctional 4-hydroxy-2-oxoglutarate aldolase/2-dehydro-3-deoxy-phosphogluconate aldolase [Nonomuraea gerenzanensis]UBU08998.1 bifunctional 4-hydroxy-2-oxoglutarate aldolase/2-dehydro-3-deoxy-phosphogluconate aldolase [Nonomuraea gerenzanensis]SBO97380.1 4-Hydroxy-2-oxoglutarate aldolase @ 2-dehydro-3-deoxyphosphogluconate aldolase [Nonomuraea gerenzanensis]
MTALDEALAALPVIAIVRAAESRHLEAVLETLAGAGVRAMEITMTTPGAAEAIRWATGLQGVAVGAGTVLDAASARRAVDAGAGYLITPAVLPEVIAEGRRLGVPVLPGAFTPTEIMQAWSQGAAMVKVFPAGAAGGPGYIKDVRAPLPHIPLVPTGGIRIEDVPGYLRAGARAVGMGSPLLGEACADGDTAALAARAGRLVEVAGRQGFDG